MAQEQYENLGYQVSEGIVNLFLNRPPANVMNIAMLSEMQAAFKRASTEPDLKVLVLRAEGKLFSGGVDVADHTPERVGEMIPLFNQVCAWLYAFPAPTIAVVQGHALGGGCELVICCDFAYMKQGARIGQPEIQLAAMAPIAALRLPLLVGDRWAARLLFMGEQIDAAKAAEIELINQVCSEDELESAVDELISHLTALSAPVLRINKRGLLLGMRGGLSELQAMEKLYLDELMALEDAEEGLKAFLEKRKPEWKDR
ncbi:MAG TPA: enoyl-CoA hydratase/isomerase family protein [Anaerolineae bacterium]|nr:enoyl-CoA hydratase/isomerase family protein [Anaerolineae bacterium]